MAASDLTSFVAVSQYLGLTGAAATASEALITSLATSVSRAIYSALNRTSLLPTAYSEIFDGDYSSWIVLKNWPVTAVSAVMIDTTAIAASPPLVANGAWQSGYFFDPWDGSVPGVMQRVGLRSYRFWRGQQNVTIAYTAGYQVIGEAAAVPATPGPYTYAVQAPLGPWGSDVGVSYATGVALTKVTGTPAVGQYSVAAGVYTFAAADQGAAVLISYGFFPADLTEAAMEWVAQRYKYSSNVGWRTKSLGGQETITVDSGAMPDAVKYMIQPYKRVI